MKVYTLKLTPFLRWNLIALKLNAYYQYNLYLMIFLFTGIIASIIFRSNILTADVLSTDNFIFLSIIKGIIGLSILYSFVLIFNLILKCIQMIKIIPEFKMFIKENRKDIKSIIYFYYLQNIFFLCLSTWIAYNILYKLSFFIKDIEIFILIFGILFSILFLYNYPLKEWFHFNHLKENNVYSLTFYIFLCLFFVFYIFIFPFCVFQIINSETFIQWKEDYLHQCMKQTKPHWINTPTESNSSTQSSPSRTISLKNSNVIEIPESETGNISIENSNTIKIIPKVPITKQIDTVNLNNQSVISSSQNLLSSNQLYLSNSKAFNTEIMKSTVLEYQLFILFFSYIEYFINICIDYLIKWNILNSIDCMEDTTSNESNPSRTIMSKNKVIIHNGGHIDLLTDNTIEIGPRTVKMETLHIVNDSDSHTRLALTPQNNSHLENETIHTTLKTSEIMKSTVLEYQLFIWILSYLEYFINISINSLIKWHVLNTIYCMEESGSSMNSTPESNSTKSIRNNLTGNTIRVSDSPNIDIDISGNCSNNTFEITPSVHIKNVHIHPSEPIASTSRQLMEHSLNLTTQDLYKDIYMNSSELRIPSHTSLTVNTILNLLHWI